MSGRIRRWNITVSRVKTLNNSTVESVGKLTEDEIIMKYAIMCPSCNRRFLMEYPYDYFLHFFNTKVIKQKRELTKIQTKKPDLVVSLRMQNFKKKSVICMDVMQIYRESNLILIAAILLLLKKSKLNFNDIIF